MQPSTVHSFSIFSIIWKSNMLLVVQILHTTIAYLIWHPKFYFIYIFTSLCVFMSKNTPDFLAISWRHYVYLEFIHAKIWRTRVGHTFCQEQMILEKNLPPTYVWHVCKILNYALGFDFGVALKAAWIYLKYHNSHFLALIWYSLFYSILKRHSIFSTCLLIAVVEICI